MTIGRPGRPMVSSLRLVLNVYEDHTFINITKAVDLPFQPSTIRLGHHRIPLGRADFTGLCTDDVLLLIATSLVGELAPPVSD